MFSTTRMHDGGHAVDTNMSRSC